MGLSQKTENRQNGSLSCGRAPSRFPRCAQSRVSAFSLSRGSLAFSGDFLEISYRKINLRKKG
jgi:hypothetical protein